METFVVRLCLPADAARLDLTGFVEHAISGSSGIFHSSEELLALIRSGCGEVASDGEREQTGEASMFGRAARTS